jgi:hypothetical protein
MATTAAIFANLFMGISPEKPLLNVCVLLCKALQLALTVRKNIRKYLNSK